MDGAEKHTLSDRMAIIVPCYNEAAVIERFYAELTSALLRLTPAVRAAVVLRHVDGLSVAETAESLGKPEGTIKAQVHRGLRELRALLEATPREPATTTPIARAARPLPALEAIR